MTPPHSTSAERAVLGACLTWPECVDEVADYVEVEDWYHEAHGLMWEGIVRLSARGVTPDAVTLPDDLRAHGTLERVGGLTGVQSVLDQPTRAGVVNYAREVADKARTRQMYYEFRRLTEAIEKENYGDDNEFQEEAAGRIEATARGRRVTDAVPMATVVKDTVGWLDGLAGEGATAFGIPTGIHQIDEWLCGLQPEGYYIIAGDPSEGKTALAMQIARSCGIGVLLCSVEMSRRQLALRLLTNESGLPTYRLLAPQYWGHTGTSAIVDAAERLHDCKIWVDDRSGITPMQVRSRARRLKRTHNIGLIIVDYLQICRPSAIKHGQNRERDVADMSMEFKETAKMVGVPLVALSQLNRPKEKRERPEMGRLRESGALEQDVDAVLFVYRPEKGKRENDEPEPAEIILAKNRITGPIGTAHVTFDPKHVCFVDQDKGPPVVEQPTPDPMADIVEEAF